VSRGAKARTAAAVRVLSEQAAAPEILAESHDGGSAAIASGATAAPLEIRHRHARLPGSCTSAKGAASSGHGARRALA